MGANRLNTQTFKMIGPYIRINQEPLRRIPTLTPDHVFAAQEQAAMLPEVFWNQRENPDPIGYPTHLEQPLLLTQPYTPDNPVDQEVPELDLPIPEPPRRRGRPARIQIPLDNDDGPLVDLAENKRYNKVYRATRATILKINGESSPITLFKDLDDEHYVNQIDFTQCNVRTSRIIQARETICHNFDIGKALDQAIEQEFQYYPDLYNSWTIIGRTYQLTPHQVKLARRSYELFKLWPEAIDFITDMTVTDLGRLTTEECQALTLRLIMEMPDGSTRVPLAHIMILP